MVDAMVDVNTRNERLEILARFLDTLSPSRFYFGRIVDHNNVVVKGATCECNSTACAVGWMPTIPEFKALGVVLAPAYRTNRSMLFSVSVGSPDYDEAEGPNDMMFDVCKRIFGLNSTEAKYLFFPEYRNGLVDDSSPAEVAAHIRSVIDNGFPDEAYNE